MFGRKKDKYEEDPTTRDIPYMTNQKTLDSYGIYPVRKRSAKSAMWQRRIASFFVLASVAFIFFAMVTSIFSGNRVSSLSADVEQNKSPAFKSRYDSLGASIVTSYFSGKTPPVNLFSNANWPNLSQEDDGTQSGVQTQGGVGPGGGQPVDVKDLSLIEAYETPFHAASGSGDKKDLSVFTNPMNEVLRYTGTIDGRQYEFGVYLIVPDINDYSKLPYLVSPPTIMPMRTLVSADIEGSKPEEGDVFTEQELNSGTVDVINKWASAYAQGDSAAIKSYTGDGRVEATYQGLGGFTLVGSPTVEWSYMYRDQESDKDRIVARISFTMSSEISGNSVSDSANNDLTDSSSTGNNEFTPVQVMDILLGNFEEGVADIMAWGPGGMWQTLTPRMNSVVPVIQEGQQSITSDTETTSTPTSRASSEESTETSGIPGAPQLSNDDRSSSSSRTSTKSDSETTRSSRSTSGDNSGRSRASTRPRDGRGDSGDNSTPRRSTSRSATAPREPN